MAVSEDPRRFAPAALRNRDAILDVLRGILPASGQVLEVASGTGEHVVHFARHLPALAWQPSDPSPGARRSIAAWVAAEDLPNLRPPLDIDAEKADWAVGKVEALACINMIHISPWAATEGLMRGASRKLRAGGLLYLYGPYRHAGQPLEPGNAAFDRDLRSRDARWGLRMLEDVIACAARNGLGCMRTLAMPANNLSVIFQRQ